MSVSLTTLAGSNYSVPLIPSAHEPAFMTASTATTIYMWNHNTQLMGWHNIASGEFYNTGAWNGSWSGTPSSNSGWTYAGTTQAGMHGHNFLTVTSGFDTNNRTTIYYNQLYQSGANYLYGATNHRATGNWVNKTKRDNLCIQRINGVYSYLWRTQVSSLGNGALMNPITSTGTMTGGTSTGVANGYNTNPGLGCVGYNESTKWWVNGVSDGSTTFTLYIYKNIEPPSLTTGLDSTYWTQFNHSTKLTATITGANIANAWDRYQWQIIPCDNGNIIVVSKTENSTLNFYLLTGNAGLNSTSWTSSNPTNNNTTTSYQNAWQNNLGSLVSYDGKYVFVWTQYYYYFSGIVGYVIRVSDGQARKISISDTTYAYSPVMIGANTMYISYGVNSDGGNGQTLYVYDLAYLFDAATTNYDIVSGYYSTTYIDNPSASTTYPMIWTMPSPIPRFNKGVI